ncbi:metal-dependent transcriptional regulator [Desulfurococcaceae archaeon MEX13E-LK6-19]|nr:metal-dependent transcriptional regulator [Desulfurococcaceae archaeon MEX13E-LK6-19]
MSCKVSARTEDYLKCIYFLEITYGRARVKDLSLRLGIRPSSVIDYLKRLSREGYITYKPGGKIKLTDKGREIASRVYEKHLLIKEFLLSLGVPEDIAEQDACYIEHGIHETTLQKIREFLENRYNK